MDANRHHPSLLLLPAPPSPATKESLNAAYRPPVEAAISKCRNPEHGTVLIVALVAPILSGPYRYSKTLSWHHAQSLVAGLYAIASAACAKLSVDAHVGAGPGSVDVRVLLVDRQQHGDDGNKKPAPLPADVAKAVAAAEPNNTAVPDLPTFAAAHRPWASIYHCGTEAGLGLFADYLRLAEASRQVLRQDQLVAVPGGVTMHDPSSTADGESEQTKGHGIVCIGGTFDHLHAGHKLLLTGGALLLDVPRMDEGAKPATFIVGITGDELLKNKKYAELVQPWDSRARSVIDFLATLLRLSPEEARPNIDEKDGLFVARLRGGAVEVTCVRIQDAFGPTITMQEVTSLVLSAETRAGGKAVNDKRAELGWPPLELFEVDVLDAGDVQSSDEPTKTAEFASKISSTTIRKLKAESRV
ncbi:hypothetical protein PpBr36_01492 [Pyricularia pennisetigena]|uniref:hypothetical protein n=1 Tax=Pyricularia pennisetigena TaxID=1578925 RepID=UPI001151BDBB|nr:hypothetical protein PpBr36_01492 [Pyricularia pennisetigena]TLS28299.1 hypothetical protein PpBr36_01492 [Pyricularia pennisetigena]